MKEVFDFLDGLQVTLNAGGMNTINIVLAFVMFGVALGIKPKMFVEVFRKPKSVILGMCCQLVLLPLLTFLLAIALGPRISWSMALGMILVASCPGGNISNFMSSLSKANVELSVSLTAISTALCILMTPFNFWLYGNLYLDIASVKADVPQLVIPLWDVFKTIFILLGIPLTLGILTSHYLPKVADKLKKPLQWLSIIFFLAMVVLSFWGNRESFLACIKYIFLIVLVHNLLALTIGFSVGSAFKLPFRDRRTLTIETGIQNSGLGLVLLLGTSIFSNLPPHGGMLVITAWWGVWHIVSGLTVSSLFLLADRRKERKQ
ncbi:MAG: bile acid:sodium symporter family protein [Bacteroidales bacterium]|nr:bile acid:sodium symporter family protein [Bacteroidales bacterium]MBQ2107641.1 bile acid:sodium symporter family protein [Bacteroidales bacterium]MBQ2229373.1 bile acid:sodium symporter family protein [Bacteroidales bacterium]MBQ2544608.1 bile acid:sodium symporter family protein [Bacteroidales bacterium]MBQ3942051.1 bile acid:sodium symporter family protein [Bacteroidales bacterium]